MKNNQVLCAALAALGLTGACGRDTRESAPRETGDGDTDVSGDGDGDSSGSDCPAGQTLCGEECASTTRDPLHCGECGNACDADEVCGDGECRTSCRAGEVACDGSCVDPQSSRDYCGATDDCRTGTTCGAEEVCNAGVCEVACSPSAIACEGACIDPRSSRQFCGATTGCRPDSNPPLGNGGAGATEGGTDGAICGAGEICDGGVCVLSCSPGLVTCDGGCIDPSKDREHCGATTDCNGGNAGVACGAGEVCANGSCELSCPPNQVDCQGRCIDPARDREHCGASGDCSGTSAGLSCASGEVCAEGSCALSCPAGRLDCGGECVNPGTDRAYCGAKADCSGGNQGVTCAPGNVCSTGVCVTSCPSGQLNCAGKCVDGTSDRFYCGATEACAGPTAGIVCRPGELCANGLCSATCPSGQIACDGRCVDPRISGRYCGATEACTGTNEGDICTATESCVSGACLPLPCGITALRIVELNIGTEDYVVLQNRGNCGVNIDPMALYFDDSQLDDVAFSLPAFGLGPWGTVVVSEVAQTGELGTPNILFSPNRGGAVYLCSSDPCDLVSGTNVVDLATFLGGTAPPPIPASLAFSPSPLTGITYENQNVLSWIRAEFAGNAPTWFQSDWGVTESTK